VDDAVLLGSLLADRATRRTVAGLAVLGPMWIALAWGVRSTTAWRRWCGSTSPHAAPTASAFSIMAVPIVGTVSAIVHRRRGAALARLAAALFVILAIASALLGRPAAK